MREILSLHIGQAGNQIGFSNWELLCAEHGIDINGRMKQSNDNMDRSFESFFSESHCGQFVPRGLFIDLEPTVINQIKTGSYRNLYHPLQLINGIDDSSGNFSRAFNTIGRLLYHTIESHLRKEIESCDLVNSILFYRSLAGGAGSGLMPMIFELLEEYIKMVTFEIPIHPSPHFDSSVVAPYNSILGEHFCMEECDIGLILDNEALFDISCNILLVKHPTMTTINRIIAQVNSCITSSSRYSSDMFNDIGAILTNLVPYPRIHFPLVSFAPLGNVFKLERDENSLVQITKSVFQGNHQLVKCDPFTGKYLTCSLVYRGLVNTCEVFSTLSEIKASRRYNFVDWCPTGFKVGIVSTPPLILPQSHMGDTKCTAVMMTNSSSISIIWQRLAQKYHRLYAKKSFVHWFVSEGLEEGEFCEALYNLAMLAKDYEEVSVDTKLLKTSLLGETQNDFDLVEEGEGSNLKIDPLKTSSTEEEEDIEDKDEDSENDNEDSNASNFLSKLKLKSFNNTKTKKNSKSSRDFYNNKQKKITKILSDSDFLKSDSISLSLNTDILVKTPSMNIQHSGTYHNGNKSKADKEKSNISDSELESIKDFHINSNNDQKNVNVLSSTDNYTLSEDEESTLLLTLICKTLLN